MFDNAAKPVIKNGPKIGWKLEACANDKYVFPNQTWTISHAMDLQLHGCEPSADNVCRVNSKPEKQIAAIQIKNANSAIMARSALVLQFSLAHISGKK